jgi:hypothetical protein
MFALPAITQAVGSGYFRQSEHTPSPAAGLLLRHGDAATSDALSTMTAPDEDQASRGRRQTAARIQERGTLMPCGRLRGRRSDPRLRAG